MFLVYRLMFIDLAEVMNLTLEDFASTAINRLVEGWVASLSNWSAFFASGSCKNKSITWIKIIVFPVLKQGITLFSPNPD